MYYSIYYINLDQLFQKVNIAKDISGHMCLIPYQNTCVLIRHFSVAKIPITHCSLYNNFFYFIFYLQLYEKLAETLTRWGMFMENKLHFHAPSY